MRRAAGSAAASSSASRATCMPLPPPPADGFTSSGKPTDADAATQGRVVECGVGDAGHGRHTGCLDVPLRADLVAHHLERFDARADEHQARSAARLGETGMLREESVARVNGLGA